jgi:hypothetical protein
MRTFIIPVVWQASGYVEVVADNLNEAKAKAMEPEEKLPEQVNYVEDSFHIDEDGIFKSGTEYDSRGVEVCPCCGEGGEIELGECQCCNYNVYDNVKNE